VNNSSGGVNNSSDKRRGDKKKNRGRKSRDNVNDSHPHPNDYISSYLTTGSVPTEPTKKQTTKRRSSLGGLKDSNNSMDSSQIKQQSTGWDVI
jgi:hypothetical protein